MTDKATHTPLPWWIESGAGDDEGVFFVCHTGTVSDETAICALMSEADARFIVHAVNSHHDLIEALREATQIADYLWRKHYRDDAPDWRPLPDLRGVISQIDNMVTGLTKEAGR